MSVLNYSQAVSSLEQKLEKIERQNSGWQQWFVSWLLTTEAEVTAQKVRQLLSILPRTPDSVPCAILPFIAEHLSDKDFPRMSFLQLKVSRRVCEIDDKNLTSSQRKISTVLSSLGHYNFSQVEERLCSQDFNEDGVFEAFIAGMQPQHLLLLKEKAISILKKILSEKGYSELQEADFENILAGLSGGKTLNAAVKERFPLDVELIINQQFIAKASKNALMAKSSWFRELFHSAPERGRFEIRESDIQCFRQLIDYLMGRDAEIEGGHEHIFRMYEQAVKYRVQPLVDFYDFKLAQCYDCFNQKEQAEILIKYPTLRAFRKLKDLEWLEFLKWSPCHPITIPLFFCEVKTLDLEKSLSYLQYVAQTKQEQMESLV